MAVLGIFLKQPIAGSVKTRLGAEMGYEASAELYAAFQRDLIDRTARLNVQRVIAYSPTSAEAKAYFSDLSNPEDVLWGQPQLELGSRLQQFFAENLSATGPVVVIGSDSPTLPLDYIQQAFEVLETHDVVLGPAVDGGYYLIGQSSLCPELFEQIDWSGPSVLSQTVQKIRTTSKSLGLLPPWYDIDSLDDLRFLMGHLAALECAGFSDQIPRYTRNYLKKLPM